MLLDPLPAPADSLPLFWQWVGLVLAFFGLAGFLMAVSPFLQMFFGRPRLVIDFLGQGQSLLIVQVWNYPVKGLLALLGVTRDEAHIDMTFAVTTGDGSLIIPPGPIELTDKRDNIDITHTLRPSYFPFMVPLITYDPRKKESVAMQGNTFTGFAAGKYFLVLGLSEGSKNYSRIKAFMADGEGKCYWL